MEKIFILWQVKTGHFVSMFLKSYFYTIMFQGWQICQYTNMNSSWHKNICIFLDKGLNQFKELFIQTLIQKLEKFQTWRWIILWIEFKTAADFAVRYRSLV